MRRRNALVLDALAAALIAGLAVTALGFAHDPNLYYPQRWIRQTELTYPYASNFPDGAFRDRVQNGGGQWNGVGTRVRFNRGGVGFDYNFQSCNRGDFRNGIHWAYIDGVPGPGEFKTHAESWKCFFSGGTELRAFSIKFDSGDNWYTGVSSVPNNRVDAWSLAAHEFGHATGFTSNHFTGGDCTNGPQPTMCTGINYGTSFARSLEEHDRHTFAAAYP